MPAATARLVNLTRRTGGRVIAAGTTVVRALESAALESAALDSAAARTVGATGDGPVRRGRRLDLARSHQADRRLR